jgi:hypothetical protein
LRVIVTMCVKSLKVCIRRVIEKQLSCKLSKRMYYYTRKRGNHFYQCFIQFYIILIHKFVVSRLFRIQFCSDLSDYRPFRLLTLLTIDPSDYWPFEPLTLRTNELTRWLHDTYFSWSIHFIWFTSSFKIKKFFSENTHSINVCQEYS